MRTILIAFFWGLLLSTELAAQTVISVDINKARLQWDWTQGTGGAVDKFNVKCGTTPTTVSKVTTIADPAARSANIRDVITGSGQWYCAVNAENGFGVSGDSNQVPFAAGAAPSAPANSRVTAN